MELDRKPFPVRLPADLHQALKLRAAELPDVTMSDLVVLGVRHVLEGAELTLVTDSAMTDAREELVTSAIGGDIGALKGAARHFGNLGRSNLSALLYWSAAEQIGKTDPKEAAREMIHTAHIMEKRRSIAIALLRRALELSPANEIGKNRLGQFLYFEGDYEGAALLLGQVKERDNHAKYFHGLASLHLAIAQGNAAAVTRSREQIVAALETWAFGGRDAAERDRWIRQVARLRRIGPDMEQTVQELIAYAGDNTYWPPVTEEEIVVAASAEPKRGADASLGVAQEAERRLRDAIFGESNSK